MPSPKEVALNTLDDLRNLVDQHELDGLEIVVRYDNNYQPVHGPRPYALTGETEVTITLNIRDEQKYAELIKQASMYGRVL